MKQVKLDQVKCFFFSSSSETPLCFWLNNCRKQTFVLTVFTLPSLLTVTPQKQLVNCWRGAAFSAPVMFSEAKWMNVDLFQSNVCLFCKSPHHGMNSLEIVWQVMWWRRRWGWWLEAWSRKNLMRYLQRACAICDNFHSGWWNNVTRSERMSRVKYQSWSEMERRAASSQQSATLPAERDNGGERKRGRESKEK